MGKKIGEIADGLKNAIVKKAFVEAIAADRMIVCKECQPDNTFNCESCGCLLYVKTRSLKTDCPENKWEKIR